MTTCLKQQNGDCLVLLLLWECVASSPQRGAQTSGEPRIAHTYIGTSR